MPHIPKFFAVCWVACCALPAIMGCQRRAYTDLYAESMAVEIRELEDRIYEYDAAYQGIEDELAVVQAENENLHRKLMAIQSEASRPASNNRSLFQGFPGSNSTPKTPSVDNLPSAPERAKAKSEKPPTKPDDSKAKFDALDLVPPEVEMPAAGGSILPLGDIPSTNPSIPSNDGVLPSPLKASPLPTPDSGAFEPKNRKQASRLAQQLPDNTIEAASENAPDPIAEPSLAIQSLPTTIDASAVAAGQIDLPSSVQAASFTEMPSERTNTAPRDTKIVEIAFHPTLCRGQNLDSPDGGDGLYLVLQPRNASGESIDQPASLTIVAVDPNRPEAQAKVGRWTFSSEQVDATLEPVGVGRGFHLVVPWQELKPLGDSIHVYVRYELTDGRRLVNERRIQLHVPSAGSATWTPRVAK